MEFSRMDNVNLTPLENNLFEVLQLLWTRTKPVMNSLEGGPPMTNEEGMALSLAFAMAEQAIWSVKRRKNVNLS
jgi:hypothetical protein